MDKIALKNKINLLQKQIAELQGQIDTVEKMPLNQRLAEVLHSKLCHWRGGAHTVGRHTSQSRKRVNGCAAAQFS